MKRLVFFWVCLLMSWHSAIASRPTVHASNFKASLITCNSLQLNWTYGDGSARLIVGREGALPDWSPSDNTAYSANPNFGKGTDQNGSGNFILYNAGGTNFIRVDSLKTGKTYYFIIYEHDNAGNSTLYYTSNSPPQESATTYVINMAYDILASDSCEKQNLFKFTNKSNSTIPGISYTFDFGDGTFSSASPASKSYTNKNGQVNIKLVASPGLGCPNSITKNVKIYPKKSAYIDFTTFDTMMCLETNYFVIDPQVIVTPLSKSFQYNWNFGDGSGINTFKKMKYSYKTGGHFNVVLEIVTYVNLQPTSCKDTLKFGLNVLPSPTGSASILNQDTFQCLKYNKYTFTNTDPSLTYFKWYYGNNDSSDLQTVTHTYKKIGKDTIIHVAYAATGCKGRDTFEIEVLPNLNTDFTGLNATYCSSNKPVLLTRAVRGGTFEGYLTSPDTSFIPNVVGKHKISYILQTLHCKDTTTKDFEIFQTPQPNLGNDVAICNGGSYNLDANYTPGTYLWNTNETTKNISISGTGDYWVSVTEGICSAADTVSVVYSTTPILDLGKDTSVCKGNKLLLNVANPNSTYLWQDGSTDSVYYVYNPGKYTVTVTNPCGVATDSIFVFFQTDYCDLFMANAFSPDNDLINSEFKPVGKNITVELFQIYNRWGQMVFETDKDNVGWNGQFMGNPAPQDLYIWKLFYTTPSGHYIKKSNASGTVLLMR